MANTSATLTCPKCGGRMQTYERNNVTIDQCTDCRGIFLDRGELEALLDAEAAYNRGPGGSPGGGGPGPEYRGDPRRDSFLGGLFGGGHHGGYRGGHH